MPKAKVQVNGKYYDVGLSASDRKAIVDESTEYANGIRDEMTEEITELTNALVEAGTYVDGAFKDGIITQIEARVINAHLKTIESKKAEMDREYIVLYENMYISTDSKSALTAAKGNYDAKYLALVNEIANAMSDNKGTTDESILIDQRFLDYNNSIALLVSAINYSIDQIASAKDVELALTMSDYVDGSIQPINTKILSMESEISQSAEQILLRVEKTELVTTLDVQKQETINEANTYADGLKTASDASMALLQQQVDDADTYIDGAFKDTVITNLEASGIEKYLNSLAVAKTSFNTTHTDLYANAYLKDVFKSNLLTAKTNLDTSYTALVNAINTAIADSSASPAESLDVDTKFSSYSSSASVYSLRVHQGTDSIAKEKALEAQVNAGIYTDGVLVPINERLVEAESSITQLAESIELRVTKTEYDAGLDSSFDYTDSIKATIDADIATVQQSITDSNTFMTEAFRDGIIYEAEYKKIQSFLLTLGETKNLMDGRYTSIYSNAGLAGTPKTNLESAKGAYDTKYAQLINTINTAIADQLADTTESQAVNTAFTDYNNSIILLSAMLETAIDSIAKAKSDKALSDAKVYTNEIRDALNSTIATLDSDLAATDLYIDNAFKDGIISADEARRISGYLNIISTSKGTFDQKYAEIHANVSLGATFKSELGISKTNYDSKYTALVDSINLAIADGKSTTAEATDVDLKFKAFNTASTSLSTILERSLDNITKNKADKALADAEALIEPIDGRLSTAESLISQHSDEIALRVTKTTFDKLTIGGRNLLLNSAIERTTFNEFVGFVFPTELRDTLVSDPSAEYTLSFDIKTSIEGGISVYNLGSLGMGMHAIASTTDFKRQSLVLNFNSAPADGNPDMFSFYGSYGTGIVPTIKNVKLEKGNKATDWTPAPEDIDADISDINTRLESAELKITPNAIIATVSNSVNETVNTAIDNSKSVNYGYRYYTSIIIYGDPNLYYPVVIKGGDQDVKRDIMVKRGYSELAPAEWSGNSTHMGSLTLKIKTNFGGWGGANYSWEVHELEEMYSTMFAGATVTGNFTQFAIFLRGGSTSGAVYHLYSDQPLNEPHYSSAVLSPHVAYNTSELIFDVSEYQVYAPAPRTITPEVIEEIKLRNFVKLSQNLSQRVSTAEATITAMPDTITLKVKEEVVDVLTIGATNLVKNGNFAKDFENWNFYEYRTPGAVVLQRDMLPYQILDGTHTYYMVSTGNANVDVGGVVSSATIPIKAGKEYIVSYYTNIHRGVVSHESRFVDVNNNWVANFDGLYSSDSTIDLPSTFSTQDSMTRHVFKSVAPANAAYVVISFVLQTSYGDAYVFFDNFQLEEGNKETAFSVNPDDLQRRVYSAESTITQQAESIALKVSTNGVISSINQTAELIKIHVNKLDIEGKVTFSSFDPTLQNDINGKATTTQLTAAEANAKELSNALSGGKMLHDDPLFKKGMNGMTVYNNLGNNTVSISRVANIEGSPTTSTHCLEVKTIGSANPEHGGFSFATMTRANAVFITRIIAKIPVGSSIIWASNPIGDGERALSKWLTPNAGTGKWEEYVYKVVCGHTGSFSSTNYYYIIGGALPLTWHIASATVFDTTDVDYTVSDWKVPGKTTIDGANIETGTVSAIKIKTSELIVGSTVTMGTGAVINWSTNVYNKPTIPTTASQIGAMPTATYIDGNGVYTGQVYASNIRAGTITGITITGSTINVDTVMTVGNAIKLGGGVYSTQTTKSIQFNGTDSWIYTNAGSLEFSSGGDLRMASNVNFLSSVNFSNSTGITWGNNAPVARFG